MDDQQIAARQHLGDSERAAGIYKAVTHDEVRERRRHSTIVIVPNNKTVADLPQMPRTTFNVTQKHVDSFFAIPNTKSASFLTRRRGDTA